MKSNQEEIQKLFKYLLLLDEGLYTNRVGKDILKINVTDGYIDGSMIVPKKYVISKNDKTYFTILLNQAKKNKDIYSVFAQIFSNNLNYELSFQGNQDELWGQSINSTQGEDKYFINEDFITNQTKSIRYEVTDEVIYTTIDNNTELDYDLKTGEIIVYYKKYNNKTAYYTKDNSIKFKYSKELQEIIETYNEFIKHSLRKLEIGVLSLSNELRKLVSTINIPLLKVISKEEIDGLVDAVDVYNKYYNKLECYKNEIINDVTEFVQQLINNPKESKINRLTNLINYSDLNDKKVLKKAFKELCSIKKENIKILSKKNTTK